MLIPYDENLIATMEMRPVQTRYRLEYSIDKFSTSSHKEISERRLWANVMQRAISDLDAPANHAYNSLQWFLSDEDDTGSFVWICDHLNLSRRKIIEKLAPKLKALLDEIDNKGSCFKHGKLRTLNAP